MKENIINKKSRTAKKGLPLVRASPFAIVGRNCKVQLWFFGSTFVQN